MREIYLFFISFKRRKLRVTEVLGLKIGTNVLKLPSNKGKPQEIKNTEAGRELQSLRDIMYSR